MDLCYMGHPNRNYNTLQCNTIHYNTPGGNTIHYNTDLHVTQKNTKIIIAISEDL
jgi:hypothetical protein